MTNSSPDDLTRYSRQALFWGIGEEGQRRLRRARVVVVGCGALGSVSISLLARAGVGQLTIVDRDFLELSNLQRQLLFEESDVVAGLPKAVAAARAVERINGEVEVVPLVADVAPANVERIVAGAGVVVDGTDNLETRYLVNDACVKLGIPWVYGGAIGSSGVSMTILPAETPCFRCVFPDNPPPGTLPTCETAGVLASVVAAVAAVQWTEAVKILVGDRRHLNHGLLYLDVWTHEYQQMSSLARAPDCPCCGRRQFDFLEARATGSTTSLCGRNAVQVSPPVPRQLDLAGLAERLRAAGTVSHNDFLVRLSLPSHELTVFADGRAIVKGTDDEKIARSLYARYVGT